MRPDYKRLKEDIIFEESQLDIVIGKIERITKEEITETSRAALAVYLMNFYNGIENIIKRCAKEYYKRMPKGAEWHKQLLQLSCASEKGKVQVFSKNVADKLYNYLLFRHLIVHGYEFKLEWEKMKALAQGAGGLWAEIKEQLAVFVSEIEAECPAR